MPDEILNAIRARDVDGLSKSLTDGTDPRMRLTRDGLTPLQAAVDELEALIENEPGGPIDAVVLLLRYGATVNSWDDRRTVSPLLTAVQINHIDAVRLLLVAGADPNVRDNEGDSPLRICAGKSYLQVARLLLQCGATKTIHEAGGAAGMNALGLAAYGLDVEMVKLLMAHGADPNVLDNDRYTVFERLQMKERHANPPLDSGQQERLREVRALLGEARKAQ